MTFMKYEGFSIFVSWCYNQKFVSFEKFTC